MTDKTKQSKYTLNMSETAKEARRAYRREWAKRNSDKVRAAQERYWEKKAAELDVMTDIDLPNMTDIDLPDLTDINTD